MDAGNYREALREAALDEMEGADIMMVKPAGAYLDIIRALRDHSSLPIAAYQVSGEYAMIKAAAERGWLDEKAAVMESLLSIKRAGAFGGSSPRAGGSALPAHVDAQICASSCLSDPGRRARRLSADRSPLDRSASAQSSRVLTTDFVTSLPLRRGGHHPHILRHAGCQVAARGPERLSVGRLAGVGGKGER